MSSKRAESIYLSESEDTDAVSLTDTVISDDASEYELDHILAERQSNVGDKNGTTAPKSLYLIKWSGYSKYKATWEPNESLTKAKATLKQWEDEKKKTGNTSRRGFDLRLWELELSQIESRRVRRHARRNKKRAKLGRPEALYHEDEEGKEEGQIITDQSSLSSNNTAARTPEQEHLHAKEIESRHIPALGEQGVSTLASASRQNSANPSPASDKTNSRPLLAKLRNNELQKPSPEQSRATGNKVIVSSYPARAGPARKVGPNRVQFNVGPAPSKFKNVFDAGKSTDIKAPITRKPEFENFKNLSHRNNTWKKSQQEAVPNLHELELKELSTGQKVSTTPSKPAKAVRFSLPDDTSNAPQPHRPVVTSTGPDSQENSNTTVAQTTQNLTCWFWKYSSCQNSNHCVLAHYDTGIVEPHNQSQRYITCQYWLHGNCFKPQSGCIYAHRVTKYVFDVKSSTIRVLDPIQAQQIAQNRANPDINQTHAPSDNVDDMIMPSQMDSNNLVCFFWAKNGRCVPSDRSCRFVHDLREYVAVPGAAPAPATEFEFLRRLMNSSKSKTTHTAGKFTEERATLTSKTAPDNPPSSIRPTSLKVEENEQETFVPPDYIPGNGDLSQFDGRGERTVNHRPTFSLQPDIEVSRNVSDQQDLEIDQVYIFTLAKGKADKTVYMVFDPQVTKDYVKAVEKAFHQIGATLYHNQKKGSWKFFHQTVLSPPKSGVILFDSEFIAFHSMPYLSHFLRLDSFNIFRLQKVRNLQPPEFRILFPSGVACYFSDSIIQEEPDKVYHALRKLQGFVRQRAKSTKILGRPGMIDWLVYIIGEESDGIKADSTRADDKLKKWKSIFLLLKHLLDKHEEKMNPPATLADAFGLDQTRLESAPPENCPLYFLPSGLFKKFDALWQKPYQYDEADLPQKAEELMLDWFSGWAIAHATEFRRFCFFTSEAESVIEKWKLKYPHLIFSRTPAEDVNLRLDYR